ncbi:MAG: hypothetical protein LQ342_003993 [Letrouitia transgressa]|nr:MAG: hypothetical protein LQ342_003993 [Letrouitia transgressa]
MSKREYFEEVCRKVKMGYFGLSGDTVARALRWLGLNSLSADLDKEIPEDDLFAKYLNAAWFKQNYSKWDSLRVEEHHILVKRLCDVLSLGLPRFQKLESIKFDDYLAWFSAESANAEFIQESGTHPELFPRGSPLSRTWKMFYPRPSKVKDRSNHVKNVMRALSKPNCFIKCLGLSARDKQGLGYQMASSLWKLESLTLQITPLEAERAQDPQNPNALGFLPQLLTRMVRLKHLVLSNLMPEEDLPHIRHFQERETNRAISKA